LIDSCLKNLRPAAVESDCIAFHCVISKHGSVRQHRVFEDETPIRELYRAAAAYHAAIRDIETGDIAFGGRPTAG